MNNHDGTFREEALFRGVALSGDGRQMAGMGVGVGRLQSRRPHSTCSSTHYYNQAAGLYRNNGKGNFDDVTIRLVSIETPLCQLGRRVRRL
jgi:enediyne biosynthesis protein E4